MGLFDALFGDSKSMLMEEIARELMADYDPGDRLLSGTGFNERFLLFSNKGYRKYSRVLRGSDRGRYYLFDYLYKAGPERHDPMYTQSVAAMALDGRPPIFVMRPEGLADRLGYGDAASDVDFAQSQAFSDSYLLRALDEAKVRAFFEPRILEYFAKDPGWSLECGGDWMILYRHDEVVAAVEIKPFLAKALEVRDVILGRTDSGWDGLISP